MNIAYQLNESEKAAIRLYLKRTYIRCLITLNKNDFNAEEKKKAFLLQMSVSTAISLLILSFVFFGFVNLTFFNAVIYLLSFYCIPYGSLFITSLFTCKFYLTYITISKRIYACSRRLILLIDVHRYIKKVKRLLSNSDVVSVKIDGDIAILFFTSCRKQVFNCHTLKKEGFFRDIVFYSFTDNTTGKRSVMALPCRYTLQLLSFQSKINSKPECNRKDLRQEIAIE